MVLPQMCHVHLIVREELAQFADDEYALALGSLIRFGDEQLAGILPVGLVELGEVLG
jgi:hypothetical protein